MKACRHGEVAGAQVSSTAPVRTSTPTSKPLKMIFTSGGMCENTYPDAACSPSRGDREDAAGRGNQKWSGEAGDAQHQNVRTDS